MWQASGVADVKEAEKRLNFIEAQAATSECFLSECMATDSVFRTILALSEA